MAQHMLNLERVNTGQDTMALRGKNCSQKAMHLHGMTIVEVMVGILIFAFVFGSIVAGLAQVNRRATWARYNNEAQKYAEQRIEQVVNAPWVTSVVPTVDQAVIANFPADTVVLDNYGSVSRTTPLMATRSVSITPMPGSISPQYKVIQVQVAWTTAGRSSSITLQTIRAPK